MRNQITRLSASEQDMLRLLAEGHDVKSAAGHLGISANVANERLRAARRKLGTTSSREAARLFAQTEPALHRLSGDKKIGIGASPAASATNERLQRGATGLNRRLIIVAGGIAMLILLLLGAQWIQGATEAKTTVAQTVAPSVIATVPGQDAIVPPGPFTLSVTFDQPMRAGDYSFVRKTIDSFPECGFPAELKDERTFRVRCTALPGHRYEIWFNSEPYMNFRSRDGIPAQPFQLRFTAAPQTEANQ